MRVASFDALVGAGNAQLTKDSEQNRFTPLSLLRRTSASLPHPSSLRKRSERSYSVLFWVLNIAV